MQTPSFKPAVWFVLSGLWPALALAQAAGETSAAGPQVPGDPVDQRSAVARRSDLWMAVDSHHRQPTQTLAPDRRLSAEQLQELREQVRRASLRGGAVRASTASARP